MRLFLVAALVVGMSATAGVAQREDGGCSFGKLAPRPAPEILGSPDLVARTQVLLQPDSPVAILRVDVSRVRLFTAPGSYEATGVYSLDVQNISRVPLTDVNVWVSVWLGAAAGAAGKKLGRPLRPGEVAHIEWKGGTGRGSDVTQLEAELIAFVDTVKTGTCTFKPSQAWPVRPS